MIDKAGTFKLFFFGGKIGFGAMQLAGPRRVRAAEGPRGRNWGAAGSGRERREPHRHQRLLRPACHQPADTRGAASISRRPCPGHQNRGDGAGEADRGCRRCRRTSLRARCTTTCEISGSKRWMWSTFASCWKRSTGPPKARSSRSSTVLAELPAEGIRASHRAEQRDADADRGRAPNLRDRLRAEHYNLAHRTTTR